MRAPGCRPACRERATRVEGPTAIIVARDRAACSTFERGRARIHRSKKIGIQRGNGEGSFRSNPTYQGRMSSAPKEIRPDKRWSVQSSIMDDVHLVALIGSIFLSGCGLPGAVGGSGPGGSHAGGGSHSSSGSGGATSTSSSVSASNASAGGAIGAGGGGGASASASTAAMSSSATAGSSSSSGGGLCNPSDPGVCCPEQCADNCCHAGNTLSCQMPNCSAMQHVNCDDSRDCNGKICCGPWDGPTMSWKGDIACQDTCTTPTVVGNTGGYELCDINHPSCRAGRSCYSATSLGHQFGYCF